jgi:hypothetical protein
MLKSTGEFVVPWYLKPEEHEQSPVPQQLPAKKCKSWADRVAQGVEHLPGKCEALSSNTSTEKNANNFYFKLIIKYFHENIF